MLLYQDHRANPALELEFRNLAERLGFQVRRIDELEQALGGVLDDRTLVETPAVERDEARSQIFSMGG